MRNRATTLLPLVTAIIMAATGSACARAEARVTPELPPLDVPAPPPRLVEPVVAEVAPQVGPIEEPAPATPAETRADRPSVQRVGPARAETPKAETPAADATKPVDGPARAQTPAVLQTIPAGKEGEVERSIRAELGRAAANLNRVEYRLLSVDGKANYDQAKRFLSQAEEALQEKNLVFASTVADKADTLAAQLAGR